MFLAPERLDGVVGMARDDAYGYLYALFNLEHKGDLGTALAEASAHSHGFVEAAGVETGGAGDPIDRYVRSLERLLDFLEERGDVPVPRDWYPQAVRLLEHFETQIKHFSASGAAGTRDSDLASDIRANFARFICGRIGCRIQIYPVDSKWFAKDRLVSWLLVRRGNPMQLHLVYDRDEIDASSPDALAREHRYEKIFLHELGHARLHTDFLRQKSEGAKDEHVHVLPRHEVEAFVYAFTVRGTILGMLSRLNRLLGRNDGTWRMQ